MRPRLPNPMMSSVIICPVVRLDESRRKDKSLSLLIAISVHVVVFVLGSIFFVYKPQFAVHEGESSVEVDLVAAADEPSAPAVTLPPVADEPQIRQEQPVKTVIKEQKADTKPIAKNKGKDEQTLQSHASGATIAVKPDYLKNPAPYYPESARRRHQQGMVLLNVSVNSAGTPTGVQVKQSSGVQVLDEAAVKVVWKWSFKPASVGGLAIPSSVDVPIRFRLE
jgi:periplasmic protein TonB